MVNHSYRSSFVYEAKRTGTWSAFYDTTNLCVIFGDSYKINPANEVNMISSL